MDAFEQVVKIVLEGQGYWVRQGFKVELSKEEKVAAGRPSSPRWEVDLVAYRPLDDIILAIECKSFLDSVGVAARDFVEADGPTKCRYKLFNEKSLRGIVLNRLKLQLIGAGLVLPSAAVQLAMAVGRFRSDADRQNLAGLFSQNGWMLIDDQQLRRAVLDLAKRGYEDNVATIIAKLAT